MHFKNTDLTRWGVGEGRLPSLSVDRNFWDLDQRIDALENPASDPKAITSVTSTDGTFTVHYNDASTDGPFALPFPTFTVLGPWTPLTLYSQPGSFVTFGGKTYLIEYPHTSAATFDAGANDGLGHDFYSLVPFPDLPLIEWLEDGYPAGLAVDAFKLFSVPDVGLFMTLLAHTAAATFDPDAEDGGGNPLYQKIFDAIETSIARIQFQYPGTPPADSSLILKYINDDPRTLVLPALLAGCTAHLEVATTTETLVYSVVYGGSEIGTFTFAPGDLLDGDGGQFAAFDGDGASILNAELLRVFAPGIADATARFLTLAITGSYVAP